MDMPPKNNRNATKNSAPKTTKKRSFVMRYAVPLVFVLVGIALLVVAAVRLVNVTTTTTSAQDKPVSDVLNMADHHQLKSVTLSGNEIFAISISGQQYHAIKEDGETVTDVFRHDGVIVNIDSTQRNQWVQGVVDLLLVGLVL